MKNVAIACAVLLVMSAAAFGANIAITPDPLSEVYPPSLSAFVCQDNGGASPCVEFSGTITETDGDGTLVDMADQSVSFTVPADSAYFTPDDTFYNETAGLLEGDMLDTYASNSYSGPIFGLDIAPGTPVGVYTGTLEILGYNDTIDPGETNEYELGSQSFTLIVTPEPGTIGLALTGLAFFATWRRARRLRGC